MDELIEFLLLDQDLLVLDSTKKHDHIFLGICSFQEFPGQPLNSHESWKTDSKPNGDIFNNNNIGMALATRKIMEEKRQTGEMTHGPSPFTKADRSKFLDRMELIVQKAMKY